MLLVPRFNRDELIPLMERRKPTLFPAVPTIYGAINSVAQTRKVHLESLKLCISGGAPLPLEVLLLIFGAVHGGSDISIMHLRKWLRVLIGRSLVLGTVDRPSLHDFPFSPRVAHENV